ncbi:hypothetical protein BJY24_005176 [Nocardia transvalensis]|uniref:Uncharacterized protein n=1 Tax=Nocardia transvalensis TaxID=37333 RepID=A0A7W9UKA9_9NOCA|nr:hypothetical protein [Nocardia transvalensis]MBB5916264.1 hypothetical protein [Nocardia transvalensis]
MIVRLRAAAVVVVLAGFFAVGAGLPLLFLGEIALAVADGRWTKIWKAALGVVATVWVTGPCLVAGWRRTPLPVHGVEVPREHQPRLWRLVDDVSERTGGPPVRELWLVPGATTEVRCDGGLLGLRPDPMRLYLDVATLLTARADELSAVIARVAAPHSARGARAVVARSAAAVEVAGQRVRGLPYAVFLLSWRWLYDRFAGRVIAAQTTASDAAADRFEDRATRESLQHRASAEWRRYREQYLARDDEPASVPVAGFLRFLVHDGGAPGSALLEDPDDLLTAMDRQVLDPDQTAVRLVESRILGRAASFGDGIGRVARAEPTIGLLLDALGSGALGPAADAIADLAHGETPAPDRRRRLADDVNAALVSAAIGTGRVGFEDDGSGIPGFRIDGMPYDFTPSITRALTDPARLPALWACLIDLGIDPDHRLVHPPIDTERPARVFGNVGVGGRRADLALFDWGMIALPHRWRWRPGWMIDSWPEDRRIERLAALPARSLLELPAAQRIPLAEIASAHLLLPLAALRLRLVRTDDSRLILRVPLRDARAALPRLTALLAPALLDDAVREHRADVSDCR